MTADRNSDPLEHATRILACIQRHVKREHAMVLVKAELRVWFLQRWDYLAGEYSAALSISPGPVADRMIQQLPKLRTRYYSAPQRLLLERYRDGKFPPPEEETTNA